MHLDGGVHDATDHELFKLSFVIVKAIELHECVHDCGRSLCFVIDLFYFDWYISGAFFKEF